MTCLLSRSKNTERSNEQKNKNSKKLLLLGLFLVLFSVGLAGAAIYNYLQMESHVGVNAAFAFIGCH
jgi:uncharacterized membrane protein YidH (DUF202 family)